MGVVVVVREHTREPSRLRIENTRTKGRGKMGNVPQRPKTPLGERRKLDKNRDARHTRRRGNRSNKHRGHRRNNKETRDIGTASSEREQRMERTKKSSSDASGMLPDLERKKKRK